jgi:hypothetical protein
MLTFLVYDILLIINPSLTISCQKMTLCGNRLKTVKSIKVRGNTLEPEVILMEKEDLKVSAQEFFLLKSWETQNFITIKSSWNTND